MHTHFWTRTLLLAAVLGCAAHDDAHAGKAPAGESCLKKYGEIPYFVDGKTKWTYFQDTVADISQHEGMTLVAFQKSAKRFELPAGADAAFLAALKSSLEKGTALHVAVDANGGIAGPS